MAEGSELMHNDMDDADESSVEQLSDETYG